MFGMYLCFLDSKTDPSRESALVVSIFSLRLWTFAARHSRFTHFVGFDTNSQHVIVCVLTSTLSRSELVTHATQRSIAAGVWRQTIVFMNLDSCLVDLHRPTLRLLSYEK